MIGFVFTEGVDVESFNGRRREMRKQRGMSEEGMIFGIVVFILFLIVMYMAVMPVYRLWSQEMRGKADLAEAEWNKQILVEDAKAKEEAAILQAKAKITIAAANAEAEVKRAEGAAEANRIVGEYLGGPEPYLRWLYIEKLDEINGQIIYLPTEAGIPVLEAGKR